jgi:hypothetical protein
MAFLLVAAILIKQHPAAGGKVQTPLIIKLRPWFS